MDKTVLTIQEMLYKWTVPNDVQGDKVNYYPETRERKLQTN